MYWVQLLVAKWQLEYSWHWLITKNQNSYSFFIFSMVFCYDNATHMSSRDMTDSNGLKNLWLLYFGVFLVSKLWSKFFSSNWLKLKMNYICDRGATVTFAKCKIYRNNILKHYPNINKKRALNSFFLSLHFFLIAILRFLPYKPEPELRDLRGKITKESAFKSDWMCKKVQCLSSPYPL